MVKFIMPLMVGMFLLAGCTGTQSGFECHATSHDSCMTMDAANKVARQKAATVKANAVLRPGRTETSGSPVPFVQIGQRPSFLPVPVRVPEVTAKVWVAPWIDRQDHFHEPGWVSFVVKAGEWR